MNWRYGVVETITWVREHDLSVAWATGTGRGIPPPGTVIVGPIGTTESSQASVTRCLLWDSSSKPSQRLLNGLSKGGVLVLKNGCLKDAELRQLPKALPVCVLSKQEYGKVVKESAAAANTECSGTGYLSISIGQNTKKITVKHGVCVAAASFDLFGTGAEADHAIGGLLKPSDDAEDDGTETTGGPLVHLVGHSGIAASIQPRKDPEDPQWCMPDNPGRSNVFSIGPAGFCALQELLVSDKPKEAFAFIRHYGKNIVLAWLVIPYLLVFTHHQTLAAPLGSVLDRTFLQAHGQHTRKNAQAALLAIVDRKLHPSEVTDDEGKHIKGRRRKRFTDGRKPGDKLCNYNGKKVRLDHQLTGRLRKDVAPCVPEQCKRFVALFTDQVLGDGCSSTRACLTEEGLVAAARLLEGLAPQFSVENMLPRAATADLEKLVDYAEGVRLGNSSGGLPPIGPEFQRLAPEVYELARIEVSGPRLYVPHRSGAENELHGSLCAVLRGLVKCVSLTASQDVAPPPFENIRDSYNPAVRGAALYFTDEGEQGRWPRRYGKVGAKEVAGGACTKGFPGCKAKSGGVFRYSFVKYFAMMLPLNVWYTHTVFLSFFCPHGFSFGTTIIPEHEGRKDPFYCLYTHMKVAPKVIVYDFACQLSEYVRNREGQFFSNTR